LPNLELDPGDYRERKPKGWRWKLPWSHAEDTKLPMVMFFVAGSFGSFFFLNMGDAPSRTVVGAIALFSAVAGGMLILWLRD
jgi:hypothetical protein